MLYLFNLTDRTFFVQPKSKRPGAAVQLSVNPNDFAELPSGKDKFELLLAKAGSGTTPEKVSHGLEVEREYLVNPKKCSCFGWSRISMPEDCPWRIYRDQTSRKRVEILVLPKRNLGSFLSELPDTTPLYSLCLPGTHDTMAFYGWPVSQCQSLSTPLSVQLTDGIRVLDIRLGIKNGHLFAFHGQFPERTAFQAILNDLHTFLTTPSSARETVVVSIKQEDFATQSSQTFSSLVRAEIEAGPGGKGMWFLENHVPTLGEVRGKAILFSRFGGDGAGWEGGLEGMGIHPTNWPDSSKEIFSWTCKDVVVRTQDWYNIPSFLSIPEKTELAKAPLLPPPASITQPVLSITYCSAASFPFATPSVVATGFGWPSIGLGTEGVNLRITRFLLSALKENMSLRAWMLMDFYDKAGGGIVPLLIEYNFIKSAGAAHSAIVSNPTGGPNGPQLAKS